MKEEIAAAVLFISKLVQRGGHTPDCYLGGFQQRLGQLLEQRFSNHWHPERPWRGQAYRCLRVNETQRREPTIEQAAKDCGLLYNDLKLPVELTIWVDPEEVCCRFGEAKGSCCVVASFKEGNKENYIENFDFSSLVRTPSASAPSPPPKSGDILQDKTNECINTSSSSSSGKVSALTENTISNIMADTNDEVSSTDSQTSPTSPSSSTSTSSPPSSTQSTPTKRKAFSPHNKTSSPNKVHHNNKRNFGSIHHHNGYNNHHPHHHHHHHHHHPPPHHHSNGSYSPPYYKSNHQSWVNLSQTPPPPHVPLFSSGSGFIYPAGPAAPPHYTGPGGHHNGPHPHHHHFTRGSPPNVGPGPQKLKWNGAGGGSSSGAYPRGQDRHPWFSHRALARV